MELALTGQINHQCPSMAINISCNIHEYPNIFSGRPSTGRMHQIRVHLQWLGHPIIDDPIYNHEAWGPGKGQGGVSEEIALKVCDGRQFSSLA